jgi:hypothetical protein
MKRFWKLLIPIVASIGMIGGTMGVAGATSYLSFVGPSGSGNCGYQYWWSSGPSPSPDLAFQAVAYSYQTLGCFASFQFKVKCGLYGVPPTYYWHTADYWSVYVGSNGAWPNGAPQIAFNGNDACPIYSNDIVLDVGIVSRQGGQNWCYRENSKHWLYLDNAMHCNIEQGQIVYAA